MHIRHSPDPIEGSIKIHARVAIPIQHQLIRRCHDDAFNVASERLTDKPLKVLTLRGVNFVQAVITLQRVSGTIHLILTLLINVFN